MKATGGTVGCSEVDRSVIETEPETDTTEIFFFSASTLLEKTFSPTEKDRMKRNCFDEDRKRNDRLKDPWIRNAKMLLKGQSTIKLENAIDRIGFILGPLGIRVHQK